MKTILAASFIFGVIFAGSSERLYRSPDAAELYAERRAHPISEDEERIVGDWAGENREVEWEIIRRRNGTYAMVIREDEDEAAFVYYEQGVWGIEGRFYYYQALEGNWDSIQSGTTRYEEEILVLSGSAFTTVTEGMDGEPLESPERRVEAFNYDLWDEYSPREGR